MRKIYSLALLACFVLCSGAASAQRDMKPFEHLAVSLNAGTIGFGIEASTPLNSYFTLRGGFSMLPLTYTYEYSDFDETSQTVPVGYTVPIDAKLNLYHGKILVDVYPFRRGGFHLTGGLLFGPSRLVEISANSVESIVIGDLEIAPDIRGNIEAWIQTNAIKPYAGIGFGHAIPKSRVGFKFELGAIFHGTPKVKTNNDIVNDQLNGSEFNDFNKLIKQFNVYPYLNFQLSYRIF